ncbi:MAG: hypothetical protein GY851_11425, partial [bacterium]|nr:hypothetical protein [bacterium]
RITSQVLVGEIAAGQVISVTAAEAAEGEGVFFCWEVVRDGVTTYVTNRTIYIDRDTTATALYHTLLAEGAGPVSVVSTRVQGQGNINIGVGTFRFSTYNVPGNDLSGVSEVHLVATPAAGWVFKKWHFVAENETSPHIVLSLLDDYDVMAEFVQEPGYGGLNFVWDLAIFLTDIGHNGMPEQVWDCDFDTGKVDYNRTSVTLLPNGLPDAFELALLQRLLQSAGFERSHVGGASHSRLWGYYAENLAQPQIDPAGQPAYTQRLLAAYMTLGTEGHRWTMPHYLSELYGLTVNPSSYTLWGARYFNKRGDVDNDGAWNIQEWENVLEASGGRTHTGVVIDAVAAAMNPATDGSVGGGELGEDEFEHDGVVYTVGSAGHIALVEEATGANDPDLTKTSVTFHSVSDGTTNMGFTAYVIDPPGYEDVPLTDWVLTVA